MWWDEDLRRRSLEAAESEPAIWDDPYRNRLFFTGTNPRMTVDNAFEKLDILQEDWVNGRMNPLQRAKCVAIDYAIEMRMSEMGYVDGQGGSAESWKASAEKLARFEKRSSGRRHLTFRLARAYSLLTCAQAVRLGRFLCRSSGWPPDRGPPESSSPSRPAPISRSAAACTSRRIPPALLGSLAKAWYC